MLINCYQLFILLERLSVNSRLLAFKSLGSEKLHIDFQLPGVRKLSVPLNPLLFMIMLVSCQEENDDELENKNLNHTLPLTYWILNPSLNEVVLTLKIHK